MKWCNGWRETRNTQACAIMVNGASTGWVAEFGMAQPATNLSWPRTDSRVYVTARCARLGLRLLIGVCGALVTHRHSCDW